MEKITKKRRRPYVKPELICTKLEPDRILFTGCNNYASDSAGCY